MAPRVPSAAAHELWHTRQRRADAFPSRIKGHPRRILPFYRLSHRPDEKRERERERGSRASLSLFATGRCRGRALGPMAPGLSFTGLGCSGGGEGGRRRSWEREGRVTLVLAPSQNGPLRWFGPDGEHAGSPGPGHGRRPRSVRGQRPMGTGRSGEGRPRHQFEEEEGKEEEEEEEEGEENRKKGRKGWLLMATGVGPVGRPGQGPAAALGRRHFRP